MIKIKKEHAITLLSKDNTAYLKAICCIIVILVHIPVKYSNPLQDAIGSFAFVAVTLFFVISSFGLSVSAEQNANYIKSFWRRRIPSLLIPCLTINCIALLIGLWLHEGWNWYNLIHFDKYVVVILEYYLFFYLVQKFLTGRLSPLRTTILILFVIISSLIPYLYKADYMNSDQLGWCYERFGLIWGILLYYKRNHILHTIRRKGFFTILISGASSLIFGTLYLKYKAIFFWGEYLLKIILGLACICFFITIIHQFKLGNIVTQFISNISYEIYLSHGIAIGIMLRCYPGTSSSIFIISVILLTVAISYLCHSISAPIVRGIRPSRDT